MNALLEQQPKRGMGCFGKSCLIFIVLAILLVMVGVGGTYWSLRHVYLSDKPAPIREATAPTEASAATPAETSMATPSEKSAEVRERLDTMKKAAKAHEATGVETSKFPRQSLGARLLPSHRLHAISPDLLWLKEQTKPSCIRTARVGVPFGVN
jgi:hypothetical protein